MRPRGGQFFRGARIFCVWKDRHLSDLPAGDSASHCFVSSSRVRALLISKQRAKFYFQDPPRVAQGPVSRALPARADRAVECIALSTVTGAAGEAALLSRAPLAGYLTNPGTFDEKLLWLNLYWSDPLKTSCADKYELRSCASELNLSHLLPRLLGVYERSDEIDLEAS